MSENGWVFAHRGAWFHPVFNNLREAAIWNFLYQNAFWKDGQKNFNGQLFEVKRGQIIVSISFLAKGFGMTDKGVRGVIQKLEKQGMVASQGASRGTIISICNYDKFQKIEKHKGEPEATGGRPEGEPRGNNKKELSNLSNLSNENPPTPKGDFPEWYGIYPHKVGRAAAEKAYAKAIKLTNREDLISGLRKYIETKPPDRPWCNPATWLNQQRWMDEPNETANTPNRISNQPSKTERAKQALLKSAIDLGYADTGPERQGGAYEHSLSVLSEP